MVSEDAGFSQVVVVYGKSKTQMRKENQETDLALYKGNRVTYSNWKERAQKTNHGYAWREVLRLVPPDYPIRWHGAQVIEQKNSVGAGNSKLRQQVYILQLQNPNGSVVQWAIE